MVEFAKGVKVRAVTTKYGEILKIGINLEEFATNPITDSGYINFDLLRAKETNNPYAALNNFKSTSNLTTAPEIGGDEIPY